MHTVVRKTTFFRRRCVGIVSVVAVPGEPTLIRAGVWPGACYAAGGANAAPTVSNETSYGSSQDDAMRYLLAITNKVASLEPDSAQHFVSFEELNEDGRRRPGDARACRTNMAATDKAYSHVDFTRRTGRLPIPGLDPDLVESVRRKYTTVGHSSKDLGEYTGGEAQTAAEYCQQRCQTNEWCEGFGLTLFGFPAGVQCDWQRMSTRRYCSKDRKLLPDVASVDECRARVDADAECGDQFYTVRARPGRLSGLSVP